MNDKIKLMCEYAGMGYLGLGEVPDYSEFDYKKFARLIAKECIDQIQEVRKIKIGNPTPEYEQGMDDGMFVAIRTIEEHFGVEE